MILRDYQQKAVEATYTHLRERDDNPCIVIPTAGGKTPVLATICKDAVTRWSGRVLILTHVKELLEQAVEKLQAICPEVPVGVYSAGLKRKDTKESVIVAGIQSAYKHACDLDAFDLVIVDEAHLIPPEGDGMYQTLLKEAKIINPNLRVIGLTATPYRMKTGMICGPDNILNHICYEISVNELIKQNYLSPLISKASRTKVDTSSLHVRYGEFISSETENLMDQDELVRTACSEITRYGKDRKSCLIFAAGIKHGRHIAEVLKKEYGATVETVFGDTLPGFREKTIEEFREGRLKYLVNVNVLTTGFDAPNIDCITLLRPTLSPGLYYQMVGRGFRIHPGKENCLILDFGGNILRHGPVDEIFVYEPGVKKPGKPPVKECPDCHSVIAAGYLRCPDCAHEFPPPEKMQHEAEATEAPILSTEVSVNDYPVQEVLYHIHAKHGADPEHPKTMKVEYRVGFNEYYREWICLEHSGYARKNAEAWWRQRSRAPMPETVKEAVYLAKEGALASPYSITVRKISNEKYANIIRYELGEIPELEETEGIGEEIFEDPEPSWMNDVEAPF